MPLKNIFTRINAITVIVGDKDKILSQLKDLDSSEIIEVDNKGNRLTLIRFITTGPMGLCVQ